MKRFFQISVWVGMASWLWAAEGSSQQGGIDASVVFQSHFAGLNQVFGDTNAARQKEMWTMPESVAFRKKVIAQFSQVPSILLSNQIPKGASSQENLFQPIIEDLPMYESYAECSQVPGKKPSFVVAIQLPADRAVLWSTNLWQVMKSWKMGEPAVNKGGWQCALKSGNVVFGQSGKWTIAGMGPDAAAVQAELGKRVESGKTLTITNWMEARINLAGIKDWMPLLKPYANLPVVSLTMASKAGDIRTMGQIHFPKEHGWKSEPWTIPTGLIRDPIISFTALEGLKPLLEPWPAAQKVGLKTLPNQLVLWANANVPFLSQFAVPVTNSAAVLKQISLTLPTILVPEGSSSAMGYIGWNTNKSILLWNALPIAVPHLYSLKDRKSEYISGSLYPPMVLTNPAPPELFRQVEGHTNLVYYDWEITDARLRQWRPIYHMLDIMHHRYFPDTNDVTQAWLLGLSSKLGETGTEITCVSPFDFKLTRRSQAVFSGFELVTLTRWLESADFPRVGSLLSKRSNKPTGKTSETKSK